MTYVYTAETKPDLDSIHSGVASSLMTDKGIQYCVWNSEENKLYVIFEYSISASDKTILDGIVASA